MSAQAACQLNDLLQGLSDGPVADVSVSGLSLDSRTANAGDLFVALSGTHAEGHRFIAGAIKRGALAVVCDAAIHMDETHAVPVIPVPDLAHKAGVIAERFYGHPSRQMFVVGVTGTNGKTSCAHFIAQALDSRQKPCAVIGTLGNGRIGELNEASHTTPDALLLHGMLRDFVAQGMAQVVMEASSHGLQQGRVSGVDFNVAVLTNLSRDHLDYHGDMDSYGRAKARLFQMPGLKNAVINGDDAFGKTLLNNIPSSVNAVVYTLGDTAFDVATVRGSQLQLSREGIRMWLETPWGTGPLNSPLLGRFNASNLLAVVAVLLLSGMAFEESLAQVARLDTVPGRMERIGGKHQPLVVVDYAHTPDALQQVLKTLRDHCRGRLWCVFGCGGDRDQGKRPQMGAIAARFADKVVLTDDNPRHEAAQKIIDDIRVGVVDERNVTVIRDRRAAIRYSIGHATQSDVVLVAGKGHEMYQHVGDEKIPFSDRAQVAAALKEAA